MNVDRDKPRIISHNLRWDIRWTGWKGSDQNDTLVGQWLAWDRRDKRYFYASVPGGQGKYEKGQSFNIDPGVNQIRITHNTPLGVANDMYEEGYSRLLKVLEDHGVDTREIYEEKL